MDITPYINDSINNLCIYINNPNKPENIHINNDDSYIQTYLSQNCNEGTITELIEYHIMDLIYSYNIANDGQRVYRKLLKKFNTKEGIYSYDDETLPAHRFPCTDDIDYKCNIKRISYRINNRIYIHYDQETIYTNDDDITYKYLYISYKHSENVDLKKINIDIGKAYRILRRMELQW